MHPINHYFKDRAYRWVWGYAIAIVFLTSIPYLLGFVLQGEAWRFSGFVFGVEDGSSYLAKMLSGARGDWLFRSPYTGMEQTGALAFLPYILLGKLTSQPGQHEQLIVLFQIFRCLASIGLVFAVYEFAGCFIQTERMRRFATVLATIGGGLGFLSLFRFKFAGYQGLPLEFYSPETFGFLAILGLPHLAAARAFMLFALIALLHFREGDAVRPAAIRIGILLTLLGLFQPLTVVITWAIMGTAYAIDSGLRIADEHQSFTQVWRALSQKRRLILWSGVFSAPIPLYSLISFSTDPFLKAWTKQNLILSPPVSDYLLAFVLVLPFAVGAIWQMVRRPIPGKEILLAWVLLFPIFAYAPYNLQRRLPEGIWVAMSILAVWWLAENPLSFLAKLRPVLYFGFITTFFIGIGSLNLVLDPAVPVYRSVSEVAAYQFLDQEPGRGVVLADFSTSNGLAAWAYKRTLIGHGPESIALAELQPQVELLLAGEMPVEAARKFLILNQVEFILVTPEDAGDLENLSQLGRMLYSADGYSVFRVD